MHMQGSCFASSTKWYFLKLFHVHARKVDFLGELNDI